MSGFGGTLSLATGGTTAVGIPVRNISLTRQASEFDMTALSDTKIFSGPGRVKRGGSFDAYFGSTSAGITTAIESVNLTVPATLTFVDAASSSQSWSIIITGADLKFDGGDAVIYSVSFSETITTTI